MFIYHNFNYAIYFLHVFISKIKNNSDILESNVKINPITLLNAYKGGGDNQQEYSD